MSELDKLIESVASRKGAWLDARRRYQEAEADYKLIRDRLAELLKSDDAALDEVVERMTNSLAQPETDQPLLPDFTETAHATTPELNADNKPNPRQRPVRSDSAAYVCIPILKTKGHKMGEDELFDASGLAAMPRKSGAPPDTAKAKRQMRRVLHEMAGRHDTITMQCIHGINYYGLREWEKFSESGNTPEKEELTT